MSDPNDALNDLLSDFDAVADSSTDRQKPAPVRRSRRQGNVYRSALSESQTDRRHTARATGKRSSVAGKYIRRSFTFRPDQLDDIDEVSGQLGLSKNDLMRWFVDMGIESVGQGERPPIAEEVRHRYDPGS
ncbi:MAG: hypothetical protein M9928_14340 [Anaerolineae bacterium]|nr:hypothetical protein [Anaerolineae bacterium]